MSSASFNTVYNLVCLLCAIFAALPATVIDLLPPAVKPYIIGLAGALMWVKSHWNLFAAPPGTTKFQQGAVRGGLPPIAAIFLALAFIAPQVRAQTIPAPEPSNFVAVGAAYNGAAGNGWVSYGKSLGAGFSSFTTYDVTLASRKPLVFQYSARTGVGFDFTTVAPSLSVGGHLHIIGLGDGGTAATAAALGTAFSGGGLASWDFGEKARHLNIIGGGRLLKTSTGGTGTVIELGIALPF